MYPQTPAPKVFTRYRDLGKAVERWRAQLAVSQDAGQEQPQGDETAGGDAEDQPMDAGPVEDEDMPAGGEYEFVKAGEQRQAGQPCPLSQVMLNFVIASSGFCSSCIVTPGACTGLECRGLSPKIWQWCCDVSSMADCTSVGALLEVGEPIHALAQQLVILMYTTG